MPEYHCVRMTKRNRWRHAWAAWRGVLYVTSLDDGQPIALGEDPSDFVALLELETQ